MAALRPMAVASGSAGAGVGGHAVAPSRVPSDGLQDRMQGSYGIAVGTIKFFNQPEGIMF